MKTFMASMLRPAQPGIAPMRITLSYNAKSEQPWSTHERNEQTGGKHGGHYHVRSADAICEFMARAEAFGVPQVDPEFKCPAREPVPA